MIRFWQILIDLGKIKILHPPKHRISYGYEIESDKIPRRRTRQVSFLETGTWFSG